MNDVKLPWDGVLMDQLDPNDPGDAEVRAVILRVQAKAKSIVTTTPVTITPCYGISTQERAGKPVSRLSTEPLEPELKDGRRLRRKYVSRSEKQAAYRKRKALQASA
jgi:hypothetical protein